MYVGLATLGWLASPSAIEHQEPRNPSRTIPLNFAAEMLRQSKALRGVPHLGVSIVGSAVYYFVGSLVVLIVNEYGLTTLGLDKEETSLLLLPVALGIAVGAVIASRFSGDRIEPGLTPLGLFGMAGALFAIQAARRSTQWVAVCLSVLGVSSGIFSLPIRTLCQVLPAEEDPRLGPRLQPGHGLHRDPAGGAALALMQAGDV